MSLLSHFLIFFRLAISRQLSVANNYYHSCLTYTIAIMFLLF